MRDLSCNSRWIVQGIGRATAMRFAREGYNVVVVARPSSYLEEAVQELQKLAGRRCASLAVPCDITNTADVHRLVEVVCDTYDSVNVVINNAGKTLPTAVCQAQSPYCSRLPWTYYRWSKQSIPKCLCANLRV